MQLLPPCGHIRGRVSETLEPRFVGAGIRVHIQDPCADLTDKGADARGVELWRGRATRGGGLGGAARPEAERWALPSRVIRSKVARALGSPRAAPEPEVAQGGVTGLQKDTYSLVAMALGAESRHSGAAGTAWKVHSWAT
ncbi:hypothetical protein MC885_012561, partial [Smutsia gigantea]